MLAFRLCRAMHPPYSAEGARRLGGRWNSKGTPVLYMSENRSLAVLEVLVHLSAALPDKYLHRPWSAPHVTLKKAKIDFGKTYPLPIVDLQRARERALEAFNKTR